MSITAKKITATTVLKGTTPSDALPVISKDFNAAVVDLTSIDARVADLEDGSQSFAEHITDTTESTSTSTGALIVDGGAAIAKSLFLGSAINIAKGNITQTGAITTGVATGAKAAGIITTVSSTLAAGSNAAFIVTNALVTSASSIQLTVDDSASAGLAKLNVQTIGAGVFTVNITNVHAANAFNNVIKIHYLIV